MSLHILACGVFQDSLRYLKFDGRYPGLRVTYLPPVLHNQPQELRKELSRQIRLARTKAGESIICMYGRCFPDIDDFLQKQGIPRLPGAHCYEMLLSSGVFNRVVEEDSGTYFLEKELIVNFSEYCLNPLELNNPDIRQLFFRHYNRLVYIRQPLDHDLESRAREVARFLGLDLIVTNADYAELKGNLLKLLHTLGIHNT